MTAVASDSAILQLPDSMEAKVPVDADHSQIVKFDNRTDDTYQLALKYLTEFEKDAGMIISGRFCRWTLVKHAGCSLYLYSLERFHLHAISALSVWFHWLHM